MRKNSFLLNKIGKKTATHKIPFLPISDCFLSHLTTSTLNTRSFPIHKCNNSRKPKKTFPGVRTTVQRFYAFCVAGALQAIEGLQLEEKHG